MVNCWTLAHNNIVSLLAVSQARGKISLAFPELTQGSMVACFASLRNESGLPTGLLDVVHRWVCAGYWSDYSVTNTQARSPMFRRA